jgi:succinate dehydrogenase flavin-adding protein (antitoxin of CptAB toxin-antitoxin module)
MADFNQIFNDIKNQLGPLAEKNLQEFAAQGKQDAEAFLEQSKANLLKWVQQLANKEIDEAEFRWLVESQKSAAEMVALRATNAGTLRTEQFRDSVLNVVVSTAVSAIAKS